MKKSLILISPLILVLGIIYYVSEDNSNLRTRSYNPSKEINNDNSSSWNDAEELYRSLYSDINTGKVEYDKLKLAKQQTLQLMMQKAGAFTFSEEGPDNVGGRTRGIAIDPNNQLKIYAGSITGGLFISLNGGNSWTRVNSFDDAVSNASNGTGSMSISSITITPSGNIYIATGGISFESTLNYEGSGSQSGDGIWYSDDDGLTFQQLSGTNNTDINKVVADPNQNDVIYYVGVGQGLKKVVNLSTPSSISAVPTTTSQDVKISNDGEVIICNVYQAGQRSYISQDGGTNWTDLHSTGKLSGSGMSRIEYAISHEKNSSGDYSLYAACSNNSNKMGGVFRSIDNGNNWCQIGPSSTPGFEPLTSRSGQGYYNLVISAIPNSDACILGGIDLWMWNQTAGGSCDDGQWTVMSNWAASPTSPFYVHADNHRITWNSGGVAYVGNDGGIQIGASVGGFNYFSVANKGYNITQFYAMAFGGDGAVMGGSQDNGTQYNDHTGLGYKEFKEVMGGDGFECEISYLSSDAMLATVYQGSLSRSDDKGNNWQSVPAPCAGTPGLDCGPFYNSIRLFEDGNDLNTGDSIQFIPDSSMTIGDTATYYSNSFSLAINYVLTQNLTVNWDTVIPLNDSVLPNFDTIPAGLPYLYNPIAQDTIMLPDYKQSLFVTQGDNNVYLTRDMMRFNTSVDWWNLGTTSTLGTPRSYDFSKDGNYLWIGSSSGSLTRVSGLDSAYSSKAVDLYYRPSDDVNSYGGIDTLIKISNGDTITGSLLHNINFDTDNYLYTNIDGSSVDYHIHLHKITTPSSFSSVITDISVDPANPNNVCVTRANTSGNHVWYSTNATSSNPTFTAIDGNLPDMPVFGCIVERDASSDVIIIGTEYGVFSTSNPSAGNVSWTAHNEEIGPIPVFDVRQQWRDWENGMVNNPGAIYLGTHGRGIWRSDDVLGTINHNPIVSTSKEQIDFLNIYPNPLKDNGTISFEILKMSDVDFKIYNLQGKLIKSITWKNMAQGSHNMEFDCSKYPNGTYFITIESMNIKKVAKFVNY